MRHRQRGVTFIGWVFLMIPVAIVLYTGIRLFPVVMNYVKVARILDQVAADMRNEETVNPQMIRSSIERRFDVDYIDYPKPKDIGVRREGSGWVIEASYEDLAPLFANASILLQFEKTATIE